MNLTELKQDEQATITSFKNLNEQFIKRLMDVGVYEQANVTLLRHLSSGHLILIEIDDVEICLRKEDALHIEVKR